ncbi:MAG: hypothetical protein WDN23_08310 [Edaphobacter sp.]
MATSAEHPPTTPPCRISEPLPGTRLQQLIDNGTLYVAQDLTSPQFATLQAIACRIFGPRHPEHLPTRVESPFAPVADIDYKLGLDELDTISRTRSGYAFAELPDEIQDAILGLITSRDLTSRKLDLALWLEQLYGSAAIR